MLELPWSVELLWLLKGQEAEAELPLFSGEDEEQLLEYTERL